MKLATGLYWSGMSFGIMLGFGMPASALGRLSAVYEVPGRDSLKSFARFETQQFSLQKDGRSLEISYLLPSELTGKKSEVVRFSGSAGAEESELYLLNGPNGTASCTESSAGMTCLLKMKNLEIDVAARNSLLRSTSSNLSDLSKKMEVAENFRAEPIGVVTYRSRY
ncbi:MAG: hypothetical protein H7222_00760 [Methylotenera sp.]|nr:hypothetical protein [Oligoflexia bacterium]